MHRSKGEKPADVSVLQPTHRHMREPDVSLILFDSQMSMEPSRSFIAKIVLTQKTNTGCARA
jgi:hypothetical protein